MIVAVLSLVIVAQAVPIMYFVLRRRARRVTHTGLEERLRFETLLSEPVSYTHLTLPTILRV